MKRRNGANKYPPDIQSEVEAACRENRSIELPASSLEKLGHHKRSVLKAVRENCLDCCGDNRAEVRRCTSAGCSLWVYRFGRNPFTDRKGPVL